MIAAMLAVAAGLCKHVLCIRTVWEATYAAKQRAKFSGAPGSSSAIVPTGGSNRMGGDMQWRVPFGASSAANWIAMQASAHFDRYGTTRETLAAIALNNRANAALNPWAIYKEPLTLDDYFGARMITTPFGLFDCDVPCDGSVAVIVSRKDVAADLRQPPIHVEAIGTQITERMSWDQGTLDHEPLVAGPAAHLWTRTDLTPTDIDMAQLYDGFTFNCLSWIEALGFCGKGEAKDFLAGGTNIARDGVLPLNTHGGQLSSGRLHGYGFIHEAVTQLRGQAGERQVANAGDRRRHHRRRRARRRVPVHHRALRQDGRSFRRSAVRRASRCADVRGGCGRCATRRLRACTPRGSGRSPADRRGRRPARPTPRSRTSPRCRARCRRR